MLHLHGDALEVSSSSPECGEARDKIAANVSKEGLKIGFTGKYLTDLLTTSDAESILIAFHGETGPAVIRFEGEVDFFSVIMPMRLAA